MPVSKTSLVNRALDLVGKQTYLDIETSDSADARLVKRQYEPVMLRCLRKSDWPFAIKRVALTPSATPPTNQFQFAYDLPSDFIRMVRVYPEWTDYMMEGNRRLVCDDGTLIIKYVSSEALQTPSIIDPSFEEYFAHELAVAISYKVSDSTDLRKDLRNTAEALFFEAASLHSQEGTDDEMPSSPWVTSRYSYPNTFRYGTVEWGL